MGAVNPQIDHIYAFTSIVRAVARRCVTPLAFFPAIRKVHGTAWRDGVLFELLMKGVAGRRQDD